MIFIKRRIEVDDYLREFIFFNINYRRNLWNKFVEEYYKCGECGEKIDRDMNAAINCYDFYQNR